MEKYGKHLASIQIKISKIGVASLKENGIRLFDCVYDGQGYDMVGKCLKKYLEKYHYDKIEKYVSETFTEFNNPNIVHIDPELLSTKVNKFIINSGFSANAMTILADKIGIIIFESKNSINNDSNFYEIFEK